MSAAAKAYERIDLRTSPGISELIVHTTSPAGVSLGAFLRGAAQERVKPILAKSELLPAR